MGQNSDPLVRLAIDVHLSTKDRFRERCAKLDVTMAQRARELLEGDIECTVKGADDARDGV